MADGDNRRRAEASDQRPVWRSAERVVEVAKIAVDLQPITNPNMKSDLTTALALSKAALEGALANVEINLNSLKDENFVAETRRRALALKA